MSEPTPETPATASTGVSAWALTQRGGTRPLALLVAGLAEQVEALAAQVAALVSVVEALTPDSAPEQPAPEENP
jgi:hypothetical protein